VVAIRAGIGQLCFGPAPRHIDVERKIAGAERDMPDPRVGCEDRVEVPEAARRLDDRDQIDRARYQAVLALQLRQKPIDRGESSSAFNLWQDDAIEAGADDRDKVAVAELGFSGIDPNIDERPPRKRERCDDCTACSALLGGCDRILEVQNDRVGIE